MRNAGVPFAPAFVPIAMSSSIFFAALCVASSALNLARSTPEATAHFSNASGPRSFWFLNAVSWNFENASLPLSAKTVCAASAAGFAFSWKGSGWFFQTMRTLSGP